MNRKRDAPPALILREPTDADIPKFNVIDSPQYSIGRSLEANLILLQKCISRQHCSIKHDDESNQWTITSHVKNVKGVSVGEKEVKLDEWVNLKCGDMINITPYFCFEFKCSPNSDQKCCEDKKRARFLNDIENVIIDLEPPSDAPSCSGIKDFPDSNLDDTVDYQEDSGKVIEKLQWQESRIKFLELKIKENEKRERELESVKDEKEVLETENADLKKKIAELEVVELQFQTNIERFKYMEEEGRTKDALLEKINNLESELKNQQDENSQLLNSICATADDMAKVKDECQELRQKLEAKFAFSVGGVPAIGPTNPINTSGNSTMPYELFNNLLKSSPITSEDGMTLRRLIVDHGAISAILACLAIYSHQETSQNTPAVASTSSSSSTATPTPTTTTKKTRKKTWATTAPRSGQYWAKGTGYGTGTTNATWNVDEALSRQRIEEQHVVVLLQILSNYINPDFKVQNKASMLLSEITDAATDQPLLPPQFIELIDESCLGAVLASYLRNDSVLDMARHIPLYRAVMALLRALTLDSQMVKFLLPPEYCDQTNSTTGNEPLLNLLKQMKLCVDTYASTIRKSNINEGDQELGSLISDIQDTTTIVEIIVTKVITNSNSVAVRQPQKAVTTASVEEIYIRVMKKLQFGSYDMISEREDGGPGFQFNIAYHYERNIRADGEKNYPARVKRLALESATLNTSLPCSLSSTVFVCCDTARLDMMKVLIIGPAETPYANGCFEFDVYFPPEYPNVPMLINLETTGQNKVRFNPNLYNDGKVCLSVLNTWHGRPEEKWNPKTSSLLQVLVSIQSLILVPDPYFNEPGYEKTRGTAAGDQNSRSYNDGIVHATVQYAMLEQIRRPSPCFKEIINSHFFMKRKEITDSMKKYISDIEKKPTAHFANVPTLKKNFSELQKEFSKLKCPEGIEVSEKTIFDYQVEQLEPQPIASTSSASIYHPGPIGFPPSLPSTSAYSPYYLPHLLPQPAATNFSYQNWQSLYAWPSQQAGSSANPTPQPGNGGLFNFFL